MREGHQGEVPGSSSGLTRSVDASDEVVDGDENMDGVHPEKS